MFEGLGTHDCFLNWGVGCCVIFDDVQSWVMPVVIS